MNGIRRTFLTALLLSTASPVRADQEAYTAEVCNKGQLGVEVAVAYTAFGLIDEYWVVDGWHRVPLGQCKTVFAHLYERQSNYAEFRRSFPVHLAFAFTDSTGVWGSANVKPPKDVAASRLQLPAAPTPALQAASKRGVDQPALWRSVASWAPLTSQLRPKAIACS
jgi:hypothetical protein